MNQGHRPERKKIISKVQMNTLYNLIFEGLVERSGAKGAVQ